MPAAPAEFSKSEAQHRASLAKVVAVNGECDRQRQVRGAAEKCPEQQAPIMETFAAKDAETDVGVEERPERLPVQRAGNPRSLVLA